MAIAIAVALLASWTAGSGASPERYRYVSRAVGTRTPAEQGTVRVEDGPGGFFYRAETRLADGRLRRVRLHTDAAGDLVRAEEEVDGAQPSRVVVRRRGEVLEYRRREAGQVVAADDHPLPPNHRPAAGPSLLALLRRFPHATQESWQVFFVDFSGRTIRGTLRATGLDRIRVPAGEFACYRLELALQVLIFRPRIQFWVRRSPPHFLVRQLGKRSALGPEYLTELQAEE